MKKTPTLSIVIPAYNEEELIEDSLKKIISSLKNVNKWEIVVADDGSRDKTPQIVERFAQKNVRLVQLEKNKGKGGALKRGILSARGKYIIFLDADLSVSPENIGKFLKELKSGKDVVIASRRVSGAEIAVHQPVIRESMGRVFTFLTRILMGVNLADFTCGFKGFSKVAAKKIFKNSVINRWAYDAEIMFLAKKYGFEITQIPVRWVNREDTRVNLRGVVLETFRDLIKIRINSLSGVYDS